MWIFVIFLVAPMQILVECETQESYNQFHKILRLYDLLPTFPFTTSETMYDNYLYDIYDLAHELQDDLRLRTFGN